MPHRLQRTRKVHAFTPPGAVYVGRPTLWANPFGGRPGIAHKRGVILYGAWLAGELTATILHAARFSEAEVIALRRWRERLLPSLARLTGRNLQCWCPLTSAWCHADVLLRAVN